MRVRLCSGMLLLDCILFDVVAVYCFSGHRFIGLLGDVLEFFFYGMSGMSLYTCILMYTTCGMRVLYDYLDFFYVDVEWGEGEERTSMCVIIVQTTDIYIYTRYIYII